MTHVLSRLEDDKAIGSPNAKDAGIRKTAQGFALRLARPLAIRDNNRIASLGHEKVVGHRHG